MTNFSLVLDQYTWYKHHAYLPACTIMMADFGLLGGPCLREHLPLHMKGPRKEPEMSQNFSSGVNRMWRLLTSHSFHLWYVPWEKPAQSTWGRCWWKAIPWKNWRCPDRSLEEPAMSTILQMWPVRFFPWTLHILSHCPAGKPFENVCLPNGNNRLSRAVGTSNFQGLVC